MTGDNRAPKDRQESPEQSHDSRPLDSRRLTRRGLLRGAGLVGAGAVAGIGVSGAGLHARREHRTSVAQAASASASAAAASASSRVYLAKYAVYQDFTVWCMKYPGTVPPVYTAATQAARHKALEAIKASQTWTSSNPLLVIDPYGTTTTGLYVYFDDDAGTLSFTCTAGATPAFTATAANHATTGGFEGLVVALVPAAHNRLTMTWTPKSGGRVAIGLEITAPANASGYATQISAKVSDEAALTPGLFALTGVVGPANGHSYLFDNHGVMRAELVSTDPENYHVVVENGRLITNTGTAQLSVMDHLGHADPIIDVDGYTFHHDLVVKGDVVYALATRTGSGRVEDRVLRIDVGSGQVAECVDLQKVLPAYEKLARARSTATPDPYGVAGKDWAHLNTVFVEGDVMYLSSRETSTIIALDNALEAGGTPSVRYMIGTPALWKGTGYQKYFLAASGAVTVNAGQHSVQRVDDAELASGQYYLEMFNNNYWYLGTRDESFWKGLCPANAAGNTATTGTSHMLRYLVDEKAGAYKQDVKVDVPYSSVVSDVFRLGRGTVSDNAVVNSGKAYQFSERSADGTVLAAYRYDSTSLGYRVYKGTYSGFWFA